MGTITVSIDPLILRTNLTWLPFWLVSTKPVDSLRRLTSRKGKGLRRPNLNLNRSDLRRARGFRWLEMQFESFFKIGERFFFGRALAGDVDFQTLRDVPIPLAPDGGGEWSFHTHYCFIGPNAMSNVALATLPAQGRNGPGVGAGFGRRGIEAT